MNDKSFKCIKESQGLDVSKILFKNIFLKLIFDSHIKWAWKFNFIPTFVMLTFASVPTANRITWIDSKVSGRELEWMSKYERQNEENMEEEGRWDGDAFFIC